MLSVLLSFIVVRSLKEKKGKIGGYHMVPSKTLKPKSIRRGDLCHPEAKSVKVEAECHHCLAVTGAHEATPRVISLVHGIVPCTTNNALLV